jgi:phenylacetic acid degradation operon negative regulatory protein
MLAPILGARRNGAVTTPSTRGLLVTVLGELVAPNGGEVWTQSLIEVLELFDIEPKASRQAIARLGQQGWLESDRFGRRTRWRLTPWADALLASGAERIYGFGRQRTEWDRQWLLAMVSVPEAQRRLRYRLEVGLGWAGFGTVGQGLWLSPWTDRESEAARLLVELDIESPVIFRAEIGDIGNGVELAARAWDLPRVAAGYGEFIDSVPETPQSAPEAAAALVLLVHQWRRFPLLDPDLPAELLPDDWPGAAAAGRFRMLHDQFTPPARQWWASIESQFAS